ncbi:histidine kinase N-terminal 7TM domain-containing protein [Paenisporosarcina indica]|uniref:sensor histidine kinase n=1 Tax=Paenisporosarcina indica TaxID=650093 RepID=UPI0009500293|nr:histidine kinase N-terminal 7TM domain-containing protein [Paenisporosarcina indica]
MTYNFYISALLMATTLCSLFIAYLAWKRREIPIVRSLFFGMLAGAFYSFGYAFEIVSVNLEQIQFWLRIEYIGISFGPLIWFTMVLQYTNRQSFFRNWNVVLLSVVPFITFIGNYTNEWHFLFYEKMVLEESKGFPIVSLTAGPLYELHVVYSYSLFIIGIGLLLHMYLKSSGRMKKQIALMMIGSCGPFGITLISISGVLKTPIDYSPFGFLFSGIFYMWGIYQFDLLKLAPLALQKVFESMKDAVIVFDLDNSVTSLNPSAQQIIKNLYHKQVIGEPAELLFAHHPGLLEKISQGPSVESKVKIFNEGNPFYYTVSVSYVYDSRHKPAGKMLVLSDVTEAVLAENTLRSNSKQLAELNLFKDKMFMVVAHDIHSPLAVLGNLMELLREEMEAYDESHEEVLYEMEQQIQNTTILVENLLDWFRSQKEGMVFTPKMCRLAEVVQANMRLLHVHSSRKSIQVKSDIPNNTLVYADPEMLDLIIRNLLSNAIKFTDIEGSIHVSAKQIEDYVIISIEDTGRGIDPNQPNPLFTTEDPITFDGTAGEKGTGLGLTLCREFVRINGGDIWFESTYLQGTIFYFSIPATVEQAK